jgi:CubicO group peptidase (beta-lactamase class C family)
MQQLERGVLALDDLVSGHVAEWRHEDRSGVTLRDLLAHCSGLPAWRPYYKQLDGREMYERAHFRGATRVRAAARARYTAISISSCLASSSTGGWH